MKMPNEKQTPEEIREKLRQEDLKNPASSIRGSNLADAVGGLSWKVTGIILIILIVGVVIYFALS